MKDSSLISPGLVTRPAYAVQAADKLIKLKQENKLWEVVAEIIKIWHAYKRADYDSYLLDLSNTKESMYDKRGGTTKTRGSFLRRTMDIPHFVIVMLRQIYTPDELPMDKKFFLEWGKRFPKMVVVEKL